MLKLSAEGGKKISKLLNFGQVKHQNKSTNTFNQTNEVEQLGFYHNFVFLTLLNRYLELPGRTSIMYNLATG